MPLFYWAHQGIQLHLVEDADELRKDPRIPKSQQKLLLRRRAGNNRNARQVVRNLPCGGGADKAGTEVRLAVILLP